MSRCSATHRRQSGAGPGWVTGAVALLACNSSPVTRVDPSAGSETHWLTACTADAECPEAASCQAGLCTVPCGDAADCAVAGERAVCDFSLTDAIALPPESAADLSGGPVGLCVGTCASFADCGADLRCTAGRCVPPGSPRPPQSFTVPERTAMDILLVVDDSGSMCEEQGLLADALRTVAPTLATLDLRMAVVSTDLRSADRRGAFLVAPAPAAPALNCTDASGTPFVPDTAHCEAALAAVALEDGILHAEGRKSPEALAAATGCLVTIGTGGDGFVKGLEAIRLALSCDGPNADRFAPCCRDGVFDPTCVAAPAFLRPDAALLVVLLSDEQDCSDPASNPKASRRAICEYGPADGPDGDEVPDGFADPELCPDSPAACFQRECGPLDADECYRARCVIDRGDNNNCVWFPEALTPTSDYVDFLRGLKRRPGLDVRVLPLVGPIPRLPDGRPLSWQPGQTPPACDPASPEYAPGTDPEVCCPDALCTGGITPSCESPRGLAYTGARYRQVAASLCGADAPDCRALDEVTICDDSYELGASIDTLLTHLQSVFCLDPAPAARESVTVQGPDGLLGPAEYAVQESDACPQGWAVRLDTPVPGATYRVRVGE